MFVFFVTLFLVKLSPHFPHDFSLNNHRQRGFLERRRFNTCIMFATTRNIFTPANEATFMCYVGRRRRLRPLLALSNRTGRISRGACANIYDLEVLNFPSGWTGGKKKRIQISAEVFSFFALKRRPQVCVLHVHED